jgi:nicotinate phosphoribosyltransferase
VVAAQASAALALVAELVVVAGLVGAPGTSDTAADAPYLDVAYKFVDYAGRPVMTLSDGKATLPGAKQVFRVHGCTDVLALRSEKLPERTEPLLEPVLQAGRRCGPRRSLAAAVAAARRRFHTDITELPDALRAINNPERLHPVTSDRLRALSEHVRQQLEADELGARPASRGHR